jgi:ferredoxin--NADP+ reductase
MPKPLTYNAKLTERIDLTDALSIFKVKPDDALVDPAWFVPGQYVVLGMNNEVDTDKGSVRRAMSIASAPQERNALEFYIRFVSKPDSENPLTHLMWKTKEGDRLFMTTKPAGVFTVPKCLGEDVSRMKVCVAAGTGLAPFISMLRHDRIRDGNVKLDDYAVLHGASYPADLGYEDEMKSFTENGAFYLPTVSRPKESPDWKGDAGRVEDYFKPDRIEETEERMGLGKGGLHPKNAAVLICGLQGTISQTIIRLARRGFVPDNHRIRAALEVPKEIPSSVFFEQYDKTPVIDLKNEELVSDLRSQLHQALGLNV